MEIYKDYRTWSDKFIPAIKQIIGPRILDVSSFEVDTQNAADFTVFRAKNLLIACRVRRFQYIKYFGQFTIRAKLDSGIKTELQKIVDGWGDIMFYGYACESGVEIAAWSLIDLNAFRAHLIRNQKSIKQGTKSNYDGTHFKWFDINSFMGKPDLLIDQRSYIKEGYKLYP